MEISYLLLIITCVLYGATHLVKEWDDFATKLINVLVFIAIIVLTLITAEDGFFEEPLLGIDYIWWNLLLPIPAIFVGNYIGEAIDDSDWEAVSAVLAVLGFIATIITVCCGI